jgi:putative membrane protein
MHILLGVTLFAAVAAFEIDMRLQGGVEEILKKRASPLTIAQHRFFWNVMYVHLFFAITTVPLWITTLILAWKRFPSPPFPSTHSSLHKPLAWLSTIDITMTSVTGLAVYYYGFMI